MQIAPVVEHSPIPSTCTKLPSVFYTFVLSFLGGCLRQVSLQLHIGLIVSVYVKAIKLHVFLTAQEHINFH